MDLPEWATQLPPTLHIEVAAKLLGIGRTTAYTEAARYRTTDGVDGLPNFRMGSRVLVPTMRLVDLIVGQALHQLDIGRDDVDDAQSTGEGSSAS